MAIPGMLGMPAALPPPTAAGAPPPGAPPNPMAMLAQRGQGGANDAQMAFLMFLAGAGFKEFAATLEKLKGKPTHHKDGMSGEAAKNPQMTGAMQLQQLAKIMAARQGAMPPGIGGAPTPAIPGSGTPF